MALILPPEIVDSIFRYVDVSPEQLLICRNWYYPIRRCLLEHIRLSPSALLKIPIISDKFVELLCKYTISVSIILHSPDVARQERKGDDSDAFELLLPYSEAWIYGINTALIQLASKIQCFQRLRSFIFCNLLEIGTSWNVIHVSTFEAILSSLSNHDLEFMKIDFPGADLENRLQVYGHWVNKTHVCEIISKHFPRSRHLHLRMREICSDLLHIKSNNRSLLETFVIDLNLEPNMRYPLEMDHYVLDCRCSERFGRTLMNVLVSDARRLSHCSKLPNINTVQFLCKCPDAQLMPTGSISHTAEGAIWTVALRGNGGVSTTLH